MFDLGFVIPLEAEARPFIHLLEDTEKIDIAGRTIYCGRFLNRNVAMVISGTGKIRAASATQLLVDRYPAIEYIHYGTAGALADTLRIGDVVCATAVVEHDVMELFPEIIPAPVHSVNGKLASHAQVRGLTTGVIISGDEDIVQKERKIELHQRYQALTVDWESAGFIFTCQLNKAHGSIFRGVSDMAHEATHREYAENQSVAIKNVLELVIELLTR